MSPAPKNDGGKTRKTASKKPRCSRCGKRIHVPAGWGAGPAVRKHYWRHHRAVMEGRGTDR